MNCPHPYEQYEYDEKLSYQIFTTPITENIDNKVIYRSSFAQEKPDTKMFPDNMTGVTFIYCNLDNVFIPEGNTIIDCTQVRYEVQNDLNDWHIDNDNKPTLPVGFEYFEKFGLPIPDPKDIPQEKVSEVIDLKKVAEDKKAEEVIN